jgi:hypothetical protein
MIYFYFYLNFYYFKVFILVNILSNNLYITDIIVVKEDKTNKNYAVPIF